MLAEYGVMMLPALVIEGKVIVEGEVASTEESQEEILKVQI